MAYLMSKQTFYSPQNAVNCIKMSYMITFNLNFDVKSQCFEKLSSRFFDV
jgi:hypothetical protein